MIVTVLAAFGLAGCTAQRHLSVQVPAGPVAFDEPLALTVSGADRHHDVTVVASATDSAGVSWHSRADYTADGEGRVQVATSPAQQGDYDGIHSTGLLWAMSGGKDHVMFETGETATMTVTFTARQAGATPSSARQERRFQDAGVRVTHLDRAGNGFVGTMYQPPGNGSRRGAVMVLGGSEGGLPASMPQALAARGHPALAVAYFGLPGLPDTLSNIPLKYFATALRWPSHQPGIDPKRITVIGGSRGSEAALLLGVDYPNLVHAVAGLSPSSVVNTGWPDTALAAWTWHGRAVPHVSDSEFGQTAPQNKSAVVPVERISGSVFLLCGELDQLWRSCAYSSAMAGRLQAHQHPYVAVTEPDAGHLVDFLVPNLLLSSDVISFDGRTENVGGSVQADALGRADAWPKLLSFLNTG